MNINPPSRHIGGNQIAEGALFKTLHDQGAVILFHTAMNLFTGLVILAEQIINGIDHFLGVAENNTTVGVFHHQHIL